ncbi:unnamed protein product [Discosporangium mesarthrocarpum]
MTRRSIGWVLCGVTCTGGEEVGCWWTTCTTRSMLVRSVFTSLGTILEFTHTPQRITPNPRGRRTNDCFITKYVPCCGTDYDYLQIDGRIRIWPVTDTVLAKRDSKNRKKGTPIIKPATVNGKRYKKLMNEEVIPVINSRMPRLPGRTIFVQQGGAEQQYGKGVMEAIQGAAGDDIILKTQPPNTLNLEVNDLGFFHSIQQLKEDVGVTNGEGLVEANAETFDIYPLETP